MVKNNIKAYSFVGLVTYFADNFGFNENETVALMGAHTLGGAATANSGHRVSSK